MLLRHAWAGERTADPDADRRRPLDTRGRRQAARLTEHLTSSLGSHLTGAQLLSSPLTRCVSTLEPLAADIGVPIATDERLAELRVPLRSTDDWPDAAWYGTRGLQAVSDAAERGPETSIVCSHGEILPALLTTIAAHLALRVPATLDLSAKAMAKGGAWLIDAEHREVTVIAPPDETPG